MAQLEGGWKNQGLTDQERALDGRAVMAAQDSQRTFERIRAQVPRWSPERKSRLVTRLAEEGLSPTQIRQQITRLGVDPAEVEGTLAKLPQPVTAGAPIAPRQEPAPAEAATPEPSPQPEPTAQPSGPEDWSDLMRGLDESVHRKAVAERHAAERTVAGHLVEAPKAVARGATGALGETLKGLQLDADRMEHRRGVGPDRPVEEGRLYRAGEFFSEGVRERLAPHPAYEQSFVQQAAEGGGSLAFYAGLAVAGRGAGMTRGGAQYVAPALSAQAAGQSEAYQNVKQFMEENPERAAELGIDDEYALELSAEGRLPGIVQILSLGPILRQIPEPMRPSASAYLLRRMAEAGVTEYTVENAGALLQNLLRREYDEDHPIWDEVPERGETAAVGAAALQALLFPLQRRGARGPSATRDTEQDAPLDSLYGQEEQSPTAASERFERVQPEDDAYSQADTPLEQEQPTEYEAGWVARPGTYADPVAEGEEPAQQAPHAEPSMAADEIGVEFPMQEVPVAQLQLSHDVPQFKRGADESGVVEPLGGQYERLGTAPILVWEREDGRQEVITGRHRLDLARRTGEQTIPAQVVREADGFTREDAMVADAEMNIRDGQGEVADYAAYFKQRGTDEAQAQRRGLLERAKGRDGFAIASQGSETLYQLHQSEQIGDRQAAAVARAAPKDERLQALGIERIQRGESIETATAMMQAVQAMGAEGRGPEQVDLFGLDDSAMRQAEELAKKAAARQREISEDIRLLRNPSKNPQRARELGIDVQDETGARERLRSLEAERERWQRWHTDPELRRSLLQQTQDVVPAQDEDEPAVAVAEGQANLLIQAVPEQGEAPTQTGIAKVSADPELVYKADGSPYPTQAAARAAARSRKFPGHTPEQVGEGAWALRPPQADAEPVAQPIPEPTAEPEVSPEPAPRPATEPVAAAPSEPFTPTHEASDGELVRALEDEDGVYVNQAGEEIIDSGARPLPAERQQPVEAAAQTAPGPAAAQGAEDTASALGLDGDLYHGTAAGIDFDRFDAERSGSGVGMNAFDQGDHFYLTESRRAAELFGQWAENKRELQASRMPPDDARGSVLTFRLDPNARVMQVERMPRGRDRAQKVIDQAQEQGYDAIAFPERGFETVEGSLDVYNLIRSEGLPRTLIVLNEDALSRTRDEAQAPVEPAPGEAAVPEQPDVSEAPADIETTPSEAEPNAGMPSAPDAELDGSLAGQLAGMDEAELSALFDEVAAEHGAAQTERPQGARAKTAEKPEGKKRPRKQQARAEQQESVERTAAEIAKSMGGNLSSAGQEAVAGLAALFGTKAGRLSSGLSFDENTYQQAKPHFQAMLRDFQAAGKDLRAFIRAVLDNFGTGIKPYVLRFARDLREGQGHGDQDAVSAGDAGAGTADVPRADALRDDGGASERGVETGARHVPRTDGQRAEVPGRGGEGAASPGGRGDRARDVHRLRERPGRDPQNFTVEPGGLQETRGPKQKAQDNLRAIELIQALEAEGRPATPEEQAQLARYIGWGGLKGAFPDAQGEYAKGYRDIGTRLRELLSDTEYRTAERSLQYAHYTSETVTRGMWDLVRRLGFDGGQVFEPGMGVGNFPATMPADVAARTHYAGLELDHITARIARALYPRWGVRQDDFTRAPLPRDTFDLVIGNPPFADIPIRSDSRYPQGFLLHDYFFAKSLDAVRPGGLLAFVTSAGTMNKADASAREYLADRADLVGAIRLPGAAFEKTAHTSVTTDIVVLRKRLEGELAGDRSWTETVEVTLPNKHGQSITGRMSRYFAENPEMVLGEQGFFDPLYENRYAVRGIKGQPLDKALARAIEQFPENVMAEGVTQDERAEIDFGTDQKKDGSFYFDGERLMQVRDGVGVPVKARGKGQAGIPEGHIERIRGLVPIRDALRAVYAADLAGQPDNAKVARQRLNEAYDAFVERFGPINKLERQYRRPTIVQQEAARAEAREEARYAGEPWHEGDFDASGLIAEGASLTKIAAVRKAAREQAEREGRSFDEGSFDPAAMEDLVIEKRENIDPFMDDPESYRLRAIERYNDETGEVTKGGVFRENIITRERAPEIRSVNDAMLHVLNRKGRLDIPEIAALSGKSQTQAIEELGESIFKLPGTEDTYVLRDAYLSGNVREKLRRAEAAAEKNPEFERNVAALEAVQPVDLTPSEISATLGAPWIPEAIVERFATDGLGLRTLTARYTPKLAYWEVSGDKGSAASTAEWGTADLSATELVEHALNRRTPQVTRSEKLADGTRTTWVDTEATQAAQDKLKTIKEKFSTWAWEDEGRAAELAEIYNEQFNSTVVREYDGSYLTTPGVSSAWQWRPHQKRVIARIIQSGNTYMAHGVGAGKTSAMIGSGMEMRRLGLVKKPMCVVPNHMLAQFTKEFYEQYPTARIAVADERRFHTSRRKQFIANVASEDLDAIIITHSAFGMIPVSNEFQDGLIQQQIDDYRELLEQMDKDAENRITRSRLQKQIERLEQRLTGKAEKATDQVFTFEEMGVDFLFVDEAHYFRKLDFATKMSGVKGVSPEGSKASWDLYAKSRHLERVNPGQNLVLASGTAVTNTMAELYTISRYLQPQELEARGLSHFDAWAGAFGDTVTDLEQDAAGNYKSVTRFAKFVNVPELSNMVRQNMDVVTSQQLGEYVTRPRLRGGKRQMNLAERSEALVEYQAKLAARMEAIERRKGPPEPGDDIMLSVINDGRHAAIDMRLADREVSEDPGSKLNMLIDNVAEIHRRTSAQPFYEPRADGYSETPVDAGPATQMIFANLGLSGTRGFSVPNYIRAELARRGVPRSEIADIRDYKTHAARQRLFNDVNEGKVRVLIGSTAKMSTGVNAQRRLYAVHNLDPLWYPADDEQRNGRILRQGNMNPEIEIHDYSTKGTYDSTMWQMMERKARFIEGFFRGDPTLRDMDDLGEASQYEQAKALSTADPRIMQLTELRQNLEREQRRKAAHQREQSVIRQRINRAQMSRQASVNRIPRIEEDIAQRQDTSGEAFIAKVGDQAFTDRLEAGQAMLQRIEELKQGQGMAPPKKIGEIGGFDIMATVWGTHERFADVGLKRAGDYSADVRVSGSARGLIQSLEHQLRGFESEIEHHRKRIAEAEQEVREYESRLGQEYDGAERLEDLQTQVRAIEAELARESQEGGEAGGSEERYARGLYHDPWLGIVPRQGPSEHYTQRQGDEADWHHSMVVVDMDAYDADDTLRYVRYGDAHEVRISGSPALAPYGGGWAQIRRMAAEMIERGTPGDVRLRVDDMALGHEMEGVDLGALRDWAEGPSLARSSTPGQGLPVEQARRHVAKVSAGWDGPRLETVQSIRDLPSDIHALAEQAGALEDMRGVYYRGVIYLVADRHDSAQALERTLLHEAVGHYGLRNLLGTRIRPVLNQVWAATGGVKGNQSIIDSYFQPGTFDPQNATHRAIIAEERLAQMAEDGTHAGIIERAVAALREWLRGLGLTIRLNDADLRALLRRAHRSLEAQTPEQMAGEAAFARRGQEGTEALDRQRQVSEGIRKGAPVDRLFSAVFDLTGSTDEYGRFRPGVQLTEQIRKTLHERTVDPEGMFGRWLHPLVERARAGLIDRYGVPESFIQRDAARESESRRILGQMEGLVEQIQKANLSREERLVLQRVLDEGEVPTEALESLSVPIRAALDDLTGQMIELGLMKADSAITDWLHRSYQKHEAELSGLPKWMHQAQRKHRKKIGGDSLRMRGLKEEVTTERLLRNVPRDWWGRKLRPGQADTHLVGTEWVMLDRLEYTPEGMYPLTGMDPAQPAQRRVRERVFWPADRELPARFDTWENRGTFEVAGTRGEKLILRRDYTRAEREDMGQVLDVRYNLIKSFQLLAHDISSARFFSDIAKNPDWATMEPSTETGEAPEIVNAEEARRLSTFVGVDWVRVPETRVAKGAKAFKWGDLAGMYVRPEIWRDLNELDIMQTPGTWRKLLTHWKLNKALALDTPIPTADGWTTMEEIQEGDKLFDENGKPCTVLEVKDVQHGRPCYRVEFSDGTSIVADDEHWWFTNHRNDGGAVRTTEEIRNTLTINHRGEAAHSIPVAGALELPDADLPLPPYALGVWLGDGHKSNPRLSVGGQDLEEIISNLESSGVVCTAPRKDKRNNVYSITIQKQPGRCIRGHDDSHRNPRNCGECEREARREKSIGEPMSPVVNADFGARMRDLGVIGDKHIPGEYLRASQQQRLELLQGIVDSDGCITTKGDCIIISSSERFARGIKELVTSLGYKPTLRPSESRLNGECVGTHWKIYFRPNTDRPVAKIRRKAERIRPASASRRRSGNRQIVSITPVDSVPVRCIAVSSESHLYLAGDGMVPTHNTARSPVVHVNNVMSNLGLMDLIDVRVRDLAAGIREFAHKGPMYQEAREHGAFGGTFVHQEIQRDVLAPIVDEMLAEARRGEESMGGRVRFLSQLGYRLWDGVKKADRRMVDFYQVEDEIFRMGTYMRLRGMGMDAPEAARQARVQFLDYNIRAPWVNAARQSVLPFISYTYRAAPAIATAIAHRPWKLAKYITIGYLANLLAFELEPGDEDEERRTMRPEVQGMTWASIPFTDIGWNRMVRLPWRDQYDNPMYLDIMRWVPAGDVFDTQQGVTGVPAWLQMGGPLQIGFELYLNKQNFTGQEIYDPLASDWRDRLNARMGFLWRAYVPSGAYIPGSWHNASLMSALRGERDLLDRPTSIPQSLASGVGIKARGHDVDLGYWFRSMEIEQRRRALHAERRALERDYQRNAISYPAYNRAVRRVEAKTDHLSSAAAAIAPR